MSLDESPVRIFIAEDNPVLLQGLERALSANGFVVETAGNGPDMLALLDSTSAPPDLLLVDVMMPRMSGFEVAQAVRRHERHSKVPLVLITAATEEVFPREAQRSGADDLMTKPFRLDELLDRIERLVLPDRGQGGRPGAAGGGVPPRGPLVA